MSNINKLMKLALKKILVPHLRSEGFSGKYPEFMRREEDILHLLSIVFDKYGGGFFLEFAPHPAGDKTMPWGDVVSEQELTTAHVPFDMRARLQESGSENSTSESWFRFDSLAKEECEALANRVVELFPQVNEWLRARKVGPNISTIKS